MHKKYNNPCPPMHDGGYVYVLISPVGVMKIGKSNNPIARIRAIRATSPTPLICVSLIPSNDPGSLEKTLHEGFSKYHSHDEWFFVPDWNVHSENFKDLFQNKAALAWPN